LSLASPLPLARRAMKKTSTCWSLLLILSFPRLTAATAAPSHHLFVRAMEAKHVTDKEVQVRFDRRAHLPIVLVSA
jgi:hypothetical protein